MLPGLLPQQWEPLQARIRPGAKASSWWSRRSPTARYRALTWR